MQLFRWMLDHTDEVGLPAGLLTGLADPALARTLVAIHEAPGEPWTLTSMAEEARLSRSTFAARFAALVGMPPAEYLTSWRVTLAQGMLRAGEPVGRTASRLGYASAPAFSRAFSQRVGSSPRAWSASALSADAVAVRPSGLA